jgi:hypothetical protein
MEFFSKIDNIKLQDNLSLFLGSSKDGIVEFTYHDIVKSAGHSCPTVAGAYICTNEALKFLYQDEIAKRGEIFISFKNDINDGTVGVISNVISQITGATLYTGFKGLNNKFVRHSLFDYNVNIPYDLRFKRTDTNDYVDVQYNPNAILPHKNMQKLMQKIIQNQATSEDKQLFGKLWQDRVERIFKNIDLVIKLK